MKNSYRELPWWLGDSIAIFAGILVPFSLAPYSYWGLSLLAPAILAYLLKNLSGKAATRRAFLFGVGMFVKGTSWVYISIHDFGYTAAPLALVLTAVFVLGLALVFAIPFYVYGRYFSAHYTKSDLKKSCSYALLFSALWVLGEWSRSWFLTGFPWLYLGYAHVDTWLAGWAPIGGVFTLSFISVFTGTTIGEAASHILRHYPHTRDSLKTFTRHHGAVIIGVLILWGAGLGLMPSEKDYAHNPSISVAIIQPNTPLEVKWNPIFRDQIMATLRDETEKHWDKDLIIWPEAAIPIMYNDAAYFLDEIEAKANETQTGVVLGILYDDTKPMTFYNSITGLGRASGMYFKQRLVPFGEYVPLEKWLRGVIAFFNLPNSIIYPGKKDQEILGFDDIKIAPSICYEIVYPDLVAGLAKKSDLLITISNDAWFGSSIGPIQHLQMAQMRALENQRYVLRGTNTGISAIISPLGKITQASRQFERHAIEQNDVKLVHTTTLFAIWGSHPIIVFCFGIVASLCLIQLKQRQRKIVSTPG
ncbi:MAG: apolipoprotein N-acyltransferase [Agarilytica sp.]